MMFLSPEIDIKLSQSYTKTYICKILYKIRSIKQVIFNKSENNDVPEELEKLKFATFIIWI